MEQTEETFYRGVVADCPVTDSTHHTGFAINTPPVNVLRRSMDSTLGSAISVEDAAGNAVTRCDGIIDGCECDDGLHAGFDRVADDSIRLRAFDCADVELLLVRWVLSYV